MTGQTLGTTTITQVGIIVHDIEAEARAWAKAKLIRTNWRRRHCCSSAIPATVVGHHKPYTTLQEVRCKTMSWNARQTGADRL